VSEGAGAGARLSPSSSRALEHVAWRWAHCPCMDATKTKQRTPGRHGSFESGVHKIAYSVHIRSRSPTEKIFTSDSSTNFVKGIRSLEQQIWR
jgi:hypothetical protein